MPQTVAFSRNADNVFFHILTQCNLSCSHCYINPAQHGSQRLSLDRIVAWLQVCIRRSPGANLIFLGGEPTLHPELSQAVKAASEMGYGSITIDTNGYLFHNILDRITPHQVNYISFSLDGADAATNDAIRGAGSFERCIQGIHEAKAKGFAASLIYTVSAQNIRGLTAMPDLLANLKIDHFFIQVIGLRGKSAKIGSEASASICVSRDQWISVIPTVAREAARRGIRTAYPKVYLKPDENFECAGKVANNYFIFPNGRVYRCPLCEDYSLHSLVFDNNEIKATAPINEQDLFALDIAEGCVMNKLVQPQNIDYFKNGSPKFKIACCLLKEHVEPIVAG
ncbi:MAG: radical SAM protein [Desulfobacteraceae bacterium]|nr:radical SAM protein [Desulfobacteraceae bacterium]